MLGSRGSRGWTVGAKHCKKKEMYAHTNRHIASISPPQTQTRSYSLSVCMALNHFEIYRTPEPSSLSAACICVCLRRQVPEMNELMMQRYGVVVYIICSLWWYKSYIICTLSE
jgi:hypothetical protein